MSKKLKFLADESLEYSTVLWLRELGYDVVSIAEDFPSVKDKKVLEKAVQEDRIVITNDKDFGDLIFLNQLPHKGVVLLRFRTEEVETKIKFLKSFLENYSNKIANKFTVIDEAKIRIRRSDDS
jgi:predicted nuclease of predicted toxin-antitoxin system